MLIKLDNLISLALASDPPYPENEGWSQIPQFIENDPLKTNFA